MVLMSTDKETKTQRDQELAKVTELTRPQEDSIQRLHS